MKVFSTSLTRRLVLTFFALFVCCVYASLAFMQQQGGPYVLNPTVVAGGGGTSTNGTTRLDGTIGQSALGLSSGGSFSLNAGFWQAASPCGTSISNQPTASSKCVGSSATFSVVASGSSLTYQWRKGGVNLSNGGNISGATSPTLTINPVGTGDAANYDVVIGSGCGNVNSNAVALTVFDYQLSSMSQNFPDTGGSNSVNVITNAICNWTAVSNDAWITINSGTPGTGNGTVGYTVAANTGAARTGTMTIAGLTFTVNQSAPTAIDLITFAVSRYDNGAFIEWQTGMEVNNLGFNIYREENGKRELVTKQLIAGSALTAGLSLRSGIAYSWWDSSASRTAAYWLEDIDLNGQTTWHGPFYAKQVGGTPPARSQAATLSRLGAVAQNDTTRVVERTATLAPVSPQQTAVQSTLAKQAAVKIAVNREGWYRLSQKELVAAGLNANVEARLLQLFADGRELPIIVNTGKDGRFADSSSIEFYGLGIDTPSTEARTYWLTQGSQEGKRIQIQRGEGVSSSSASFTQTVERRDRSIYFAALLNGDKENFFGAAVASQPIDLNLNLRNLAAGADATIDLSLQGVTQQPHRVLVQLNGVNLGEALSLGQENKSASFTAPANLLRDGANTLRLVGQNGGADVSLVDTIRVSYAHSFRAADDALRFTVPGREAVTVTGFTARTIRVFDITDSDNPREVAGKVVEQKDGFGITVAANENGNRTLLATTEAQMKRPLSVKADEPSSWRSTTNAADFVILAPRQFFSALEPLRAARQAGGLQTVLVDIADVYDEFNFGNKAPQAVKDFLNFAAKNWQTKPRFVMLTGDASYDAKNYLGLGDHDLVATKLLDATYLETASDEWFTDFDNDGVGELATGRLPVRTAEEAALVVGKLLRSDAAKTPDSALLVADRNEGYDFEAASAGLRTLLEPRLRVDEVRRGQLPLDEARRQLFAALARGEKLVNYMGHGSVNQWNGQLLNADEARNLTNDSLPVFTLMNCLNGYVADATLESLGEALLKAERGGAVAVWASSGLTTPAEQAVMNQEFYRLALNKDARGVTATLGEAAQRAKAVIRNTDIRRTWILLGDPTQRLK